MQISTPFPVARVRRPNVRATATVRTMPAILPLDVVPVTDLLVGAGDGTQTG